MNGIPATPTILRPGREHERQQARRGIARDILLALADRVPVAELLKSHESYADLAVRLADDLLRRLESDPGPHVAAAGR